MKHTLLFLLYCLGCCTIAAGQSGSAIRALLDEAAQSNQPYRASNLFVASAAARDEFGEYSQLEINFEEFAKLKNERPSLLHLRIPQGSGQALDLELVRVEILRANPTFYVKNAAGRQPATYEPGVYYRGFIRGAKSSSSLVALSVLDEGLMGLIADETGNWNIGPQRNEFGNRDYVLFNDRSHPLPLQFGCGTSDESELPLPSEHSTDRSAKSASVNCVDVYYECDNNLFQLHGSSVWQTLDYATGLFNIAATIYQNENIDVRMSSAAVWNTPDGYSENNSSDALNSFIAAIGSGFDGDIAQLVAVDTGGHGGLAVAIGFTCGSNNNRHCFSDVRNNFGLFPAYSWDADVTTHEMGHLLGSRHTHWCGWLGGAIDNCYCQGIADGNFPAAANCREPNNGACVAGPIPTVGTLMSYCHGATGVGKSFVTSNGGGFGTQPANAIIAYIDGLGCLGDCNCPVNLATTDIPAVINVTAPPELEKFEASNSIESNSTINSGTFVKLDAGFSIRLTPGFWARSGSNVHAYIEGCGWLDGTDGTDSRPRSEETLENQADFQVVPNPSNGVAIVQFILSQPEKVSLTIHNLSGGLVCPLRLAQEMDAGPHSIPVNEPSLSAGIYFVVLRTGSTTAEQKWVIVN